VPDSPTTDVPPPPSGRRVAAAAGTAALLLITAACSAGSTAAPAATSAAPAPAPASASAAPAGSVTPSVTAAANAFLATLDDTQKGAVQFDWTDTAQKQRWSNFPYGIFDRTGLRWGDLTPTQQNAWLAVMQKALSGEGYDRVQTEWSADDANATETGQTSMFGRQYYYIALIGTPSDTSPWMWQFGGHHVTVNATVAAGRVSVTPSFIGDQPSSYTDANGATVRPLGDIADEATALVNSLDDTQRQAAVLSDTPIDLVLGPGEDGKTIAAEGLPLSRLTPDQQTAALELVAHYTGLVDDVDAAARLDEVKSVLDRTDFAWYGPTTAGGAAYFRIAGPNVVIEYAPQGGGGPQGGGRPQGGTPPSGAPQGGGGAPQGQSGAQITGASTDHIHGIYRDPSNEYGAKYAS
jgi:Protein of unknown function (DUF3500)